MQHAVTSVGDQFAVVGLYEVGFFPLRRNVCLSEVTQLYLRAMLFLYTLMPLHLCREDVLAIGTRGRNGFFLWSESIDVLSGNQPLLSNHQQTQTN